MLSLLDHNQNSCYRVPLNIVSRKDPYVLAAYLASLRYSSRFNEATGTINQYISFFGVKVDSHVGSTIERMRKGLTTLCELGYLNCKPNEMKRTGPNQGFCYSFKANSGWRYDEYPLAILFSIKEITQATKTARNGSWTGADNLIDILHLTATFRSYMDTPTDSINPTVRFQESVATVDYKTCLSLAGITDRKLNTRLKRMQSAGLGVYQIVTLEHPELRKKPKLILVANKSKKAASMLTKARKNLRDFYEGYSLTVG